MTAVLADESEYLNQSEFGREIGVSQPRVSRYVKTGRLEGAYIKRGRRTLIHRTRALAILGRNLDPAGSIKAETESVDDDEKRAVADEAGTGGLSYQKARALNEQFKAALNKLRYDRESGKTLDVEETGRVFFDAGRSIRDQLLAIPERCAALIAAEYGGDQHECREILRKEILSVCKEINESGKRLFPA